MQPTRICQFLVFFSTLVAGIAHAATTDQPTDWSNFNFTAYTHQNQVIYDFEGSHDPSNGGSTVSPSSIDLASCSADGQNPGSKASFGMDVYDADANPETYNDAWLGFRFRLRDNPTDAGKRLGLSSAHWAVMIDTDNDGYRDIVVDIDGSYAADGVDRVKILRGTDNLQSLDEVWELDSFYAAGPGATGVEATNSHTRIVTDTSVSCLNNQQYWLDVQIPFSAFFDEGQQIDENSVLRFYAATSTSANNPLQTDWMSVQQCMSDSSDLTKRLCFGDNFSIVNGLYPAGGSLRITSWADSNANGIREASNEQDNLLFEGETASLTTLSEEPVYDILGNLLGTINITSSAVDGNFQITTNNIPPGSYWLTFNPTESSPPITASNPQMVTITADQITDANIGHSWSVESGLGQIGGMIFRDDDGDGKYDPDNNLDVGEFGSITIEPEGCSGVSVSNGGFDPVGTISASCAPGSYTVTIGTNNQRTMTTESNYLVTVEANETTKVFFGWKDDDIYAISGVVFEDLDGDGEHDSGEPLLQGVSVDLLDSNKNLIRTHVTGTRGFYAFYTSVYEGSPDITSDGIYYVRENDPENYTSVTSNLQQINYASVSRTVNFADQKSPTLNGMVFQDQNADGEKDTTEPGIPGAEVRVYNSTETEIVTAVISNSDGSYNVGNLDPGSYIVKVVSPTGFYYPGQNVSVSITASGSNTANFGLLAEGTVVAIAFDDRNNNGLFDSNETALANVEITLEAEPESKKLTDHTGTVFFTALSLPAEYTFSVGPEPLPNYSSDVNVSYFDPFLEELVEYSSQTLNISEGQGGVVLFPLRRQGTISVVMFEDLNDNGVQDPWEWEWWDEIVISGDLEQTVYNSHATFSGLTVGGSYTITANINPQAELLTETVFTFAPYTGEDQTIYIRLIPPNAQMGVVCRDSRNYQDCEQYWNEGSLVPIPNVEVQIEDTEGNTDTTTTDQDGFYSFEGMPDGDYTVTLVTPSNTTSTGPDSYDITFGLIGDFTVNYSWLEFGLNYNECSADLITTALLEDGHYGDFSFRSYNIMPPTGNSYWLNFESGWDEQMGSSDVALGYDRTSGHFYEIFLNWSTESWELYQRNATGDTRNKIGEFELYDWEITSGTIDDQRNFYLVSNSDYEFSRVYKLNLDTLEVEPFLMEYWPVLSTISYNPFDGMLYALDDWRQTLWVIDPQQGTLVHRNIAGNPGTGYHSSWFDAAGRFYFWDGRHGEGTVMRITDLNNPTAEFVSMTFNDYVTDEIPLDLIQADSAMCNNTIQFEKSVAQDEVPAGSEVSYTFTIGNGTDSSQTLQLTDNLPEGFNYVADTLSISGAENTPTINSGLAGGTSLDVSNIVLAALSVATITVDVRVSVQGGTYYNQALLSGVPIALGGNSQSQMLSDNPGGEAFDPTPITVLEADPNYDNALSGTVFNDLNSNGVQDTGENGISSATVQLLDYGISTVTDNAGNYEFTYLPERSFNLQLAVPSNYVALSSTAVEANAPGTADFALLENGEISVTVFDDQNGNGQLDGSEPPLNGITVTLLDEYQEEIGSGQTKSSGLITFSGISPGNYWVEQTDSAGYNSTTANLISVVVHSSQNSQITFGDQQTGSLAGEVFDDIDGDGIRDNGEPGLANVTLTLSDGSTVLTDANGQYEFTSLEPGTYVVTETDPASYTSSTSNQVSINIAAGGSATASFGDQQTGAIQGYVYNDLNGNEQKDPNEPPLENVTITLSGDADATATTDQYGFYQFDSIVAGNYSLTETDPAGYSSISANTQLVHIAPGGAAGVSFADQQQGTLSGIVFHDLNGNGLQENNEPGLSNIAISLDDGDATVTNASGVYSFSGKTAGAYIVSQTDAPGYTSITLNDQPASLSVGGIAQANFADIREGVIGGMVFSDFNGNGILDNGEQGVGGVTVSLDSGEVTTTAGDGSYLFTNIFPGQYIVTETDPSGYYSITDNRVAVSLAAGGSATARFADQQSGQISGIVYNDFNGNGQQDTGETGIGGIVLTLDTDPVSTVTTANDGSYVFTGVTAGAYSLTQTDAIGYISTTPNSVAVNLSAGGAAAASFGDQQTGTVSGIVFVDTNGNGVQDAGESGIGGVSVVMGEQSVTTSVDGRYLFAGVTADNYTLSSSTPDGFVNTSPSSSAFELPAGDSYALSFGYQKAGIVSGISFNDLNGNGVKDPAEPGLAGVSILLSEVGTAVTAGDGSFLFSSVSPGSYTLSETDPAGFLSTTPNSVSVELASDSTSTATFANQETGIVAGIVFSDTNGNGSRDAGEPGLGGAQVSLSTIGTVASFGDGSFSFNGVPQAEYDLSVTAPTGFTMTTDEQVVITVTSGGADSTLFGLFYNNPPVAVDDIATLAEDAVNVQIDVLANDSDPDTALDTESIQISQAAANGTATVDVVTGTILYTPTADYAGSDVFYYTVNDTHGLESNSAQVTLSITPANDPPLAQNQTLTTAEDTPLSIMLDGSDIDGDELSYSIVSSTSNGVLSGTAPELFYTPAANFNGTDSLTFIVNDGTVDSELATVNITITPLNDIPVATPQSLSTAEDTPLSISLSGSDPDGDSLTYSLVSGVSNGVITGTSPNLVYTPAENYTGADSLTFKVNDGLVDSAVATISINVAPVNDPPTAEPQTLSTPEDTPLSIMLSSTDTDGGEPAYTIVSSPTNGAIEGAAPEIGYTPDLNFTGTDTFTFIVNDGTVDSALATVTINVTPVNDAPVADPQSLSTTEETPVSIMLSATDSDGDELTYSIVSNPTNGTVSGSAPEIAYTPGENFSGTDTLTFKVNDGTLDSAVATVTINVAAVNDAPEAEPQALTTAEETPVSIMLSATDADGDELTYSIVSNPANGTLSGTAPEIAYTPGENFTGTDTFTFKVNDGTVDSPAATVTINVTPVNDAPVAEPQSLTTAEETPASIMLSATDSDGDELTYSLVSNPANGTISGSAPEIAYTPGENFTGTDTLTFKVNDGTVDSPVATVTITVTPVNDAPAADPQSLTTAEETPVSIMLSATDADGDELTYSLVSNPANGTVFGTAPEISYTPADDFTGTDTLTFKVNDGIVDSPVATVTINVTPLNDPPIALPQSLSTPEDTPLSILLSASDVEGDELSYTIVSNPANGTLSGTAPEISYTPAENFTGTDSLTFKVNDGSADSTVATVNIDVRPSNDTPAAHSQSLTTAEDTPLPIVLTGSDPEGDELQFILVTQPASGSLTGTAPNLTYTPDNDFTGNDTFTFKVNDGTEDSAAATISIDITPANDAPAAQPQALSTAEDTPLSIMLTGTDIDGDELSYAVAGQPQNGTLSGTAPDLIYTPNENFTGDDNFTFKVNDGDADSAEVTVSIEVTPVNDRPVAENQSLTTEEDTAVAIGLQGSDPDGDALSYTVISQPANGMLSGNAPDLTYTPNTDFTGTDQFQFMVNDGTEDSEAASVTIQISPVNDPPEALDQSLTTAEDTAITILLTGSDPENDTLSYALSSEPGNGTLSGEAPELLYTPDENYTGTDSFKFTVNDGTADSALATITIEVTPVDDAPEALSQSLVTDEDIPLSITLTGVDVDEQSLQFEVVSQPVHGSLSGQAPDLVYTPNENFNGDDRLTFKVISDGVASDEASVEIVVNPLNDPPVAVDDSYTLEARLAGTEGEEADTEAELQLLVNDFDPDEDSLTLQSVTDPQHGTIVASTDDSVSYLPKAGYSGQDSFEYTISDPDGETSTANVVITIISDDDIDGDGVSNEEDSDVDGDGIEDALDEDADGDGIANIDDKPIIIVPANVTVDATALFTKVDIGEAEAYDYQGKKLPVSTVDSNNLFWPGANKVIWQATDNLGNTTTADQFVYVRPIVSFSKDQTVAEGSQAEVKVVLNGPSPFYPVTVTYTIEGTAAVDNDHDLTETSVTIESGTEASIWVNTIEDEVSEGNETILLTMSDADLNQGVKNTHQILITEQNIAPDVTLDVQQDNYDRLTVSQIEGPVVVSSVVFDSNVGDTHSYDWSQSSNVLTDIDEQMETFTFDPSVVPAGLYEVVLKVTDDGIPPLSTLSRVFIKVMPALPELDDSDTDNDGIADSVEGFADEDRDGIPDYKDSVSECNILPEQGLTYDEYLVEGDPGLCLRVGPFSGDGELEGAQLTHNDIAEEETDTLVEDTEAENVGGIFDFIVTRVPDEGQAVNIVIPQRRAVPEDPVYRKLYNGIWFTFIEDDINKLWSTAGEPGYCPPPGSDLFTPGLTPGHYCVQMTIEDGGPNDADKLQNRMIVDPGGVGTRLRSGAAGPGQLRTTTSGGGSLNLISLLSLLLIWLCAKTCRLYRPLTTAVQRSPKKAVGKVMLGAISAGLLITNGHAQDAVIPSNQASLELESDTLRNCDEGETATVNRLLTVTFDNDKSLVKQQFYPDLQTMAQSVTDNAAENVRNTVVIRGHTSSPGTHDYNMGLSTRRADAVARVLAQFGVKPEQIETYSFGETQLLQLGNSHAAHAANRRAELAVRSCTVTAISPQIAAAKPEPAVVPPAPKERKWYLRGDIGYAMGSATESEVAADLQQVNSSANLVEFNDDRMAYSFGFGYLFRRNWGLELAYVNLGENKIVFDAPPTADYQALSKVHPLSSQGLELSARYFWNFRENFGLSAQVGLWRWKGDYSTTNRMLTTPYNDAIYGTDLVFGGEIFYKLNNKFTAKADLRRYFVDDQHSDTLSLGLRYWIRD